MLQTDQYQHLQLVTILGLKWSTPLAQFIDSLVMFKSDQLESQYRNNVEEHLKAKP